MAGKAFGLIGALVAGLALSGCSKKQADAPVADAPAPAASSSTATGPDPIVQASLDDIKKKLEQQQYDAAVGGLVGLNGMPKTPAQEAAFLDQVRMTQRMLGERAAQGDQKAMESQQMLGRFMTGR